MRPTYTIIHQPQPTDRIPDIILERNQNFLARFSFNQDNSKYYLHDTVAHIHHPEDLNQIALILTLLHMICDAHCLLDLPDLPELPKNS